MPLVPNLSGAGTDTGLPFKLIADVKADRSNPAKLLFEIGLGEHQGGRTAVRAVMRVGHQVPAFQKRSDLRGRKEAGRP